MTIFCDSCLVEDHAYELFPVLIYQWRIQYFPKGGQPLDLEQKPIITVRKRSCGKVMFSQACVKNSVHRGVYIPWGNTPWAETDPLGRHPLGRHPLGRHPPPPQADGYCVDGMHPTGMHSCLSRSLPKSA